MREREIIAELRLYCADHPAATELLTELDSLLGEETWVPPAVVMEIVRKVYPGSSVRGFVNRAIHAHYVWNSKYGPFNRKQAQYETDLLLHVTQVAAGSRGKLLGALEDLVNHEDVDAGFKRRAFEIPIKDILSELA